MGALDKRGAPKIRPGQIVVTVVVLGLFIAGVLLGGFIGALTVGLLAVGAGALLVARWHTLDPKIRIFRAGTVIAALAVAVSLLSR